MKYLLAILLFTAWIPQAAAEASPEQVLEIQRPLDLSTELKFEVFSEGKAPVATSSLENVSGDYCAFENIRLESIRFVQGAKVPVQPHKINLRNAKAVRYSLEDGPNISPQIFCDFSNEAKRSKAKFDPKRLVKTVNRHFGEWARLR
jgi:hypothetical protein